MKTINKLLISAVVTLFVVSSADNNLHAMRKRFGNQLQNERNKQQRVETQDHQTINTQCTAIREGIRLQQITQELFLEAAGQIATALKKLKAAERDTCIKISDVIKAFFEFLLGSIQRAEDKQNKIYEVSEVLIGVEDNELQNNEAHENPAAEAPIFAGQFENEFNSTKIFELLKGLFDELSLDVRLLRATELREALQQARRGNQEAGNQVIQNRQGLEQTLERVNELNEEANLQLENVQQDTQDKQRVAQRYQQMNTRALENEQQLKQLLNGEEQN